MPMLVDITADLAECRAEVEKVRHELGLFLVAAEKTRMAMLFTDASVPSAPIIFANDAFLRLTGLARQEVIGTSFTALLARGTGSDPAAENGNAIADLSGDEPDIFYRRKDGAIFWASLFICPVLDEHGDLVQHFISLIDHTKHHDKQAQCEMLLDELNHRVKNTLSTVQSIVQQSLLATTDPAEIQESIESRLLALSRSHDLLTRRHWEGAALRDLVDAVLTPFSSRSKARPMLCVTRIPLFAG